MPLGDFRSVFFPYCIKRLEGGFFIILNREYKPIGFNSSNKVNYEDYPIAVKIKGLTTNIIEKLAYNGEMTEEGFIFLYNDSCIPTTSKKHMRDYLEKLEMLAPYKISKN